MTNKEFTNTLYTNDNLFILTGMNSNYVDLIYLDPPFNSKRMYSAPVGSKAAGTSFKDMWTWNDVNEAYLETLAEKYPALTMFIATIGEIHSDAMKAYLTYMAQRIVEMHRVLKDTGSLYLHCDPTASHYLKIVMDEIFGKKSFRNEIIWKRATPGSSKTVAKRLGSNHDIIFYYAKSQKTKFNLIFTEYPEKEIEKRFKRSDEKGRYKDAELATYSQDTFERLKIENRLITTKSGKYRYKIYLDEIKGVLADDIWTDLPPVNSQAKERTGYPTQKPLKLLHRIIKASSNEGDIILDPFCGCATTCVAAQQLGRKWIGIDVEKQAVSILVERLSDDAGLFKNFINTMIVPQRTDIQIVEKSSSVKERLFKQQNGICNGCRNEYLLKDFEIDHIIPVSKGGGSYYENYQLLCGNCNKTKNNRPMEYLRIKVKAREKTLENKIIFGV